MSDSDLADEVRRLRAELDEVKQLLRESDRGLSRPTRATWAAIDADDGTVRSDSESDSDAGSVSRRHALHTAGVIVAGALAGGIATVATAGPAAAAQGTFDGNPAVSANGGSGTAVQAQTTGSGNAVNAYAASGDAVHASAYDTYGVGVYGNGGNFGGQFSGRVGVYLAGSEADIYIEPSGNPPSSYSSTTQVAGSLKLDQNSVLWLCVAGGTPGVWQQIGGLGVAGAYHAVTPSRVYDSRLSSYPLNGVLSSGQNRTISVANSYNTNGTLVTSNFVPAGATAVFANVTVVDTVGAGYLAVNRGGTTSGSASTINWSAAGQILANGVALTLNGSRQLTVVAGGPGSTNFIIDITGYWL